MPVVQNIHSRMRSGSSFTALANSWKYTISTGAALALVGFILQYFVGPSRFLDFEILSLHFLAVILIFIGTVLLEVGILVFLPNVAMRALIGFSFITRTISTRNIAREFQKSLFTIMTSALALAFIIVVGLISAAVISGVPAYYESQWGAIDLVAETRDSELLPTNVTDRIDNIRNVIRSSYIQEVRTEIEGFSSYAFGVDPFKYAFFSEPAIDSISIWDPYILLNQSTVNRTIGVISHILFQKLHVPLGANVTLKIADNSTVNITLAAVVKANVFLGSRGDYLYIPSAQYREFFNSTEAKWFICDVNDDTVSIVKRNLGLMFPEFKEDGIIPITFFSEMMKQSLIFQSAIFQVLFVESFILAAIAQFVCILVSTLRMEREIGIMRSMGLNRRGVFGIFMTESIALGASALLVGLLDGLIGAVLLADYISESVPINVSFPAANIGIWMGISFLITIFSTILPSYRSSRKNIVATISGRPMVKGYKEKDPYRLSIDYRAVQNQYIGSHGSSNPANPYIHHPGVATSESTLELIEQRKMTRGLSQSGILRFIKNNTLPIQTIFLLLMAIITFNYILDESVIIRGLNLFDTVIRSFISFFFSGILEDISLGATFLGFNPFLAIVGCAMITPIAHYLTHKRTPDSIISSILGSLFWAIVGLIFLAISLFLVVIVLWIIYIPINDRIQDFWVPGSEILGDLYVFVAIL
ncbi:MAG: ABC transporter permease, partial [Candidatus Hodarchaeales archaeon]